MADNQTQSFSGQNAGTPPPPPPPSGNSTGYIFGELADKLFAENPPKIIILEHPNTTFDEKKFLRCLAGSISLLWQEKAKIIESVPKLSQYQIDELQRILNEETDKFKELSKEHGDQLKQLEQKHLDEFRQIETMMAEDEQEGQADEQADQIRK